MIVLVRHGRTDVNASGRLLGRLDPDLDDAGVEQASAVAAVVVGATRLVSSPLRRALATAEALALPVETEVDPRWIELDYGSLDGVPLRDVPAAVWDAWRADVAWAPDGGESLHALGERVRAACDELAPDAAAGDVVVVTHVSPIKAAVAWALGVGDDIAWRLHVAPASVTRIAITPRGPVVHGFNDVSHL